MYYVFFSIFTVLQISNDITTIIYKTDRLFSQQLAIISSKNCAVSSQENAIIANNISSYLAAQNPTHMVHLVTRPGERQREKKN